MLKKDKFNLECIQCNKCQANCPVNTVIPDFSPRAFILEKLLGDESELIESGAAYKCLTCFTCQSVCASKTDFPYYSRQMRKIALEKGIASTCKHGNILRGINMLSLKYDLKQDRLSGLPQESFAREGETYYFAGCIPYFAQVFSHTDSAKTLLDALKLFNHTELKPVMSDEEKCCGYDFFFAGMDEEYEAFLEHNRELFKKLGIKTVITTCPECLTVMKEIPEIKAVHITEYLDAALKEGKLRFKSDAPARTVTYHDPCRLSRVNNIVEPPRRLLKAVPNLKFVELENNKQSSICCGVGNFVHCDANTKFLQNQRIGEFGRSGAEAVSLACPKCNIHLNCYLDGRPIEEVSKFTLTDITSVIREALQE
ncbi:MAG: (Fe-S)-binding protein [Myxococcota bacterium]